LVQGYLALGNAGQAQEEYEILKGLDPRLADQISLRSKR